MTFEAGDPGLPAAIKPGLTVTQQRRLVYISHQLGGYDGVSIEAAKWIRTLAGLGYTVTAAAGRLLSHNPISAAAVLTLPALWRPELAPGRFGQAPALTQSEIAAVLKAGGGRGGCAVLDNLATLPTATANVVCLVAALEEAGMRMVVRHHDPDWDHHTRGRDDRFPLNPRGACHVAISSHVGEQLRRRRGIHSNVLFNTLELDTLLDGDRSACRRDFGFSDRDLVLLHPVTPYRRKQVEVAARFADSVCRRWDGRVVYWLTGAGRDPLEGRGRYIFHPGHCGSRADMYAAADAVLLTSAWEGWGVPAAEAAALGLPIVTGRWPALADMRRLGLRDIPVSAPDAVSRLLAEVGGKTAHRVDEFRAALGGAGLTDDLRDLLSKAGSPP